MGIVQSDVTTANNSEGQQTTTADVQQTSNQEQQQTQETKIDWSKVNPDDIPEDVVKKHKFAKNVLDESIKRRKLIGELKDQLAVLEGEKPEAKPADKKKPETSSDVSEMPAWAKEMMNKVTAIETAALMGKRNSVVETVLEKHRLPAEAARFLTGDTEADLDASAAELAKLTVPERLKGGTGHGNAEDATARASRIIAERLSNAGGVSKEGKFFDPVIHRQK